MKWSNDPAIVDRLVDFGRRIGIIRRNSVRRVDLTGSFDCGFQPIRCLKVERQFSVQVVLLENTNFLPRKSNTPRGVLSEEILKG